MKKILVKSCTDCPLRETEPAYDGGLTGFTYRHRCSRVMGKIIPNENFNNNTTPEWCPLPEEK